MTVLPLDYQNFKDQYRGDGAGRPAMPQIQNAGHLGSTVPPRGWLLGNSFCRKFLSAILAPGGVGKTTLRLLQAMALATGKPLSGEHVFHRTAVLLITLEDDLDELHRRVLAAMQHHGILPDELDGWLYIVAAGGLKIARLTTADTIEPAELVDFIREAVSSYGIGLVSLDPFVKCHGVEENDNGSIDRVVTLLANLAIELDIAIDAPHHTRKGGDDPGNADQGRGASAFKDGGRLVYTLGAMSQEDADMLGVSHADRTALVRLDPGKVNLTPKANAAKWFKLVSVELGNGTPDYPAGDKVQSIEPWIPSDVFGDLNTACAHAILDDIDAGLDDGEKYSPNARAEARAAWRVVKKHAAELTEAQCRSVIKTWLKNGVIEEIIYRSRQRKDVIGLASVPGKRPG